MTADKRPSDWAVGPRAIWMSAYCFGGAGLWLAALAGSVIVGRWANTTETPYADWIFLGSAVFAMLVFPFLFMIGLSALDRRLPTEPATPLLQHDAGIDGTLVKLSRARNIGFAAACLERLLPVCERARREYGCQLETEPAACLDAIWAFLIDGTPPPKPLIEQAHRSLDKYDTDEDVPELEYASALEEWCAIAVVDLQEILLSLHDPTRGTRYSPHRTAFHITDLYLDSIGIREPELDGHELIILEMYRQQEDLDDLDSAAPDAEIFARLRDRARTQPLLGTCWFASENW